MHMMCCDDMLLPSQSLLSVHILSAELIIAKVKGQTQYKLWLNLLLGLLAS